MTSYEQLARKLDALPNGYPPAEDGSHLRLLEKLFSPEEVEVAALLNSKPEALKAIAERTGRDARELREHLNAMAKRGLITMEIKDRSDHYCLMPFVVGFFENQNPAMDEDLARLFEAYFQNTFTEIFKVRPQFHRVVPIDQAIDNNIEIHPYETVSGLVDRAGAWSVVDCICRKQQNLIGEGCDHPLDVCMILSAQPNAFHNHPFHKALTREEAHERLKRAADAGLVHSVSNTREDTTYICNCCTCSCRMLRGVAKVGAANIVARSAFVCVIDEDLCVACETCRDYCQFDALALDITMQVDPLRCVGCGVCVSYCPSEAMTLVRRSEDEIAPIPATEADWASQRSAARGLQS